MLDTWVAQGHAKSGITPGLPDRRALPMSNVRGSAQLTKFGEPWPKFGNDSSWPKSRSRDLKFKSPTPFRASNRGFYGRESPRNRYDLESKYDNEITR